MKLERIEYEIEVDVDDFEDRLLVAHETWKDGLRVRKTMDEIIIGAANYATSPTGTMPGAAHYSWFQRAPLEEPKRVS